ncbi:hypothetical protein HOS78_gp125 [Lactobacillus phage Bacchae]|uniref:Uncharacterized protein n=1 Tax=Lactobacillus phage Bacchae TaxID=2079429 RepID=A0A2K9VCV7_9CAUD|nr:hypothetical protein HOS78_gp125 [Lactobacillus phage Bacchae]AUV60061.1 hypothetical protein [Lactobacillus phage Bacchae]
MKTVKVANNMQLFDDDGYHYNRCLTLDIKSFNKFLTNTNQLLQHEKGYSSDRTWLECLPTKQLEKGILTLTLTQARYLIQWLKSNGYIFKGHKIKSEVNTVVKLF